MLKLTLGGLLLGVKGGGKICCYVFSLAKLSEVAGGILKPLDCRADVSGGYFHEAFVIRDCIGLAVAGLTVAARLASHHAGAECCEVALVVVIGETVPSHISQDAYQSQNHKSDYRCAYASFGMINNFLVVNCLVICLIALTLVEEVVLRVVGIQGFRSRR